MINIDIYFDTICPWCFIGKHRLDRALAAWPEPVHQRWHPFLLNPDMPRQGMERRVHLLRKFGTESRINRLHEVMRDAGRAEGIGFALDRIARVPNTIDSHRLIRLAAHEGLAAEAVERLFNAYFRQGLDIGNINVLVEIGSELGMNPLRLRRHLEGSTDSAAIEQENFDAHRQGVNGVPAFLVENRFAISGAQESEVFLRLFDLTSHPELAEALL